MITSQLLDQLGRNLTVALSADADLDLTLPGRDAGKAIMWDETDKKLINSTDDFNSIVALAAASQVAAAASQVAAAASAAAALDHRQNAATFEAGAETAETGAETAQTNAEAAETSVYNFPNTPNEWTAVQHYQYRAVNPVGASLAIDFDEDPLLLLGLEGNFSVTFSNLDYDKACVIQMWNNSGGRHTITWPSTIRWMEGADSDGPPSGLIKFVHLWCTTSKVFASVTWEGTG